MNGWTTVAQATRLQDLESVIGNMELKKGTKLRVVMSTSAEWLFDSFLAEPVFARVVPDGMDLIDVWGENGKGIIEMEADPAWLVAVLGFIRIHWVALTIAGFLLWLFVSFIIVMVKVPIIVQVPFLLLAGAGLGIIGFIWLLRKQPTKGP